MTLKDDVFGKLHNDSGRTVVQIYREIGDHISMIDVRASVNELIREGLCTTKGDDLFRIYFKTEKARANLA